MSELNEQFENYEKQVEALTDGTEKVDVLNQYSWKLSRIDPQKALHLAEQAHELSKQLEYVEGEAEGLKNLGQCYWLVSQFASALEKSLSALQMFEVLNNKQSLADSYNILGAIYSSLGEKENALKYYYSSLELKKEIGDKEGEARALNSIGDFLMNNGEYEEARKHFEECLNVDHSNDIMKGIGLYNLGEINYHLKEYDIALEYLAKGNAMGESMNFALMTVYCSGLIGEIELKKGNTDQAIQRLDGAMKAAVEVDARDRIYALHKAIYKAYKQKGKIEKALEHFEQYHRIKEEVYNEDNSQKIKNLQFQYQSQSLQREAELEKRKNLELQKAYDEIERLSVVASKTNSGVVILDANGDTKWVNEGYTNITGYTIEDLQNNQPGDLLLGEGSDHSTLDRIREKASKQEPFIEQILIYTRSEEPRWIKINNTPIFSSEGVLTQQVEIIDDVTERINAEQQLQKNHDLITQQNKDIMDSVRYAERIQTALLPQQDEIGKCFNDHFIVYHPRDIVSGDFYWFSQVKNFVFLAVADCTGHGVPGAFVSMIGHNLLNQIINDENVTSSAQALNILDQKVSNALHKDSKSYAPDGMDIAFCVFDLEKKTVQFSGAFRPLIIIRDGELLEYTATKFSIGSYTQRNTEFKDHNITLETGDAIYMFTDGFIDQFGGPRGKKFMSKRLKKLLMAIQDNSMDDQKKILEEKLESWRGELEQVDDICMIGIKI
jgi:PAS domain S-box-containing protein